MRRIVVIEIVQDSKEKLVEFDDLRGGTTENPAPTDPPDLKLGAWGGVGVDGNLGGGVEGTLGGGVGGGGVGTGKQNDPSNL